MQNYTHNRMIGELWCNFFYNESKCRYFLWRKYKFEETEKLSFKGR